MAATYPRRVTSATGETTARPELPPTPEAGLTGAEVERRRAAGLGNAALPATTRTYIQILRENVFTFVNNILFALGIALVLVGRPVDALVSLGVISANVVVGIVQEIRAKRTLDRIALLTRPTAAAVRNGEVVHVSPDDLVLGDLLAIDAGDQVVLDGRLRSGSIGVDESQLTGESDFVGKRPGDELYSGSYATSGSGRYIVEKVSTASLANQITAGARSFRRVVTPLQVEINLVIRVVLGIVLYLEVLLVSARPGAVLGAGGRGRGRDAARGSRAQRPVRVDRGRIRAWRTADPALRRPGPAGERDRIAEPRGRAVPRQDGHADGEPAAGRGGGGARRSGRGAGHRSRIRPGRVGDGTQPDDRGDRGALAGRAATPGR